MTRLRRIKLFSLALTSFVLILVVVNVYEYLKVRNNIVPSLMSEISNTELSEIRSYFTSVSEQLNVVKEWGKNGVFQYDNTKDLNKIFFPLLEQQGGISSLVLANNLGDEYFLFKDNKGWITRQLHATNDRKHSLHFTRWTSAEQKSDAWKELSDYDPRETAWFFPPDSTSQVRWSLIHTFMQSKEEGITAAISWANRSSSDYTVFGLDIPITSIKQFLSLRNKTYPGIIFIFNRSGDFFIASDFNQPASGEQETAENPEQLLARVLEIWKSEGQPHKSPLRFSRDKEKWLASLQPLDQAEPLFWLGVAVREKEFLAQINSKLFQTDKIDLAIAFIGSGLLYFLLWGMGRRQTPSPAPPAIVRLNSYINKGEGVGIEFKSTIRTNLKTAKHGKEIELAWLKAVVAFLNSAGGVLLIGVDDAGKITGLQSDGFENRDKSLLHVKNLVNHHIGAEFSSFLETTIVEIEEKEVLMIECNPVSSPVFLNIGKNEEFYVRSGPSSTKLSPSQTVHYVMQKGLSQADS
ncbi:MAG: ATP-binding protein [Deltaproteobacteria bacterium]|nr:ATP-binding protein [Deltaproteobacteria bacterium]